MTCSSLPTGAVLLAAAAGAVVFACASQESSERAHADGAPPATAATVAPAQTALPPNDAGASQPDSAGSPDVAAPVVIDADCGTFPPATDLEANGSFAFQNAQEG